MKQFRFFVVAGVLLTITAPAFPCTCDYSKVGWDLVSARRKARAIFVGTVTSVIPARQRDPEGNFTNSSDSIVELHIERYWKGVKSASVEVIADDPRGCAGPKFEVGKNYLVYAYGKHLWTGGCTRSRLLEYANEDLVFLGKGRTPKQK